MNVSLPNAIVRNRLQVAECRTDVMPSGEWYWNACYNSRVDLKNVLPGAALQGGGTGGL